MILISLFWIDQVYVWFFFVFIFLNGKNEFLLSQKFGNVEAAQNAFAELTKVTNHTALWDAKLTWYSPRATHHICLNGLEHTFGIHGFRLT